jgi:hypothetical protein
MSGSHNKGSCLEAFGKSSLKSESKTDMNKSEILLNKSVAEGL